MRIKSIISILLTLVLCLTLCSCNDNEKTESNSVEPSGTQKQLKNSINLLFSSADSFNPYTIKTDMNMQICQLLYEPLVTLDNNFNPVNKIASKIEISNNKCKVTLKNVVFSDNTPLTADDVIYSYNLAINSKSIYSSLLYEVKSVSAENSSTVVFNLSKKDLYFKNLLIFPIIKAGSEKDSDSDGVKKPPIGCGRFKVDEEGSSLIKNDNYYGKSGSITKINLINAPDNDSVAHYVEIGATDMYYSSISNGSVFRMSGKKTEINLNNIVYIGVNHNVSILKKNELRQAISSGIDRKKICKDAFYNHAIPATGFFNPVWNVTKSVQNIQTEANSQITIENLEKIVYNNTNNKSSALSFTLLVNSDNSFKTATANIIASQLKAYGIKITVVEKKFKDYKKDLKNGKFQLYLGEVRIPENMDISCLINSDGSAAYGIKKEKDKKKSLNNSQKVLKGYYDGKNSITDVASVLQSEMPFIPVCFRTGVLFYNDNIENINGSSKSDIYSSIESYNVY